MDIGKRVKQLRKQHGWSQKELSKIAELSPQTVFNIEHGEVKPGYNTQIKLALAFKMELPEFLQIDVDNDIEGYSIKNNEKSKTARWLSNPKNSDWLDWVMKLSEIVPVTKIEYLDVRVVEPINFKE